MTALRRTVPLSLLALSGVALAAGCSESHTMASDDAGRSVDAPSTPGCGDPPFVCVTGSATPHVCSDGVAMPGCLEGGVWQCPLGMTPEPIVDCWCYGSAPSPSCVCLEGPGWWCEGPPDAGVPGCPADPSSAEGTPCSPEGTSCGRCLDSCGFCNIPQCRGGLWTRLEAFPPPPPCTSFDCGPELRCAAETEYCERQVSDVVGEPDGYACRRLPDGCPSGNDCDCISVGWTTCERGPDGGLDVVYPGG